jgi:starch synthase
VRVVHVASEVAPWAQTGGLADVVAALPAALVPLGVTGAIVAPLYRSTKAKLEAAATALEIGPPRTLHVGPHWITTRIVRGATRTGVPIAWVDAPALFDRDGIYGPGGTGEYPDNHVRFAALCRLAVDAADELVGGPVDVIHGHDWQGALAPAYARLDAKRAQVATVTTIHNLAFRGIFPKIATIEVGLPWVYFDMHHYEFWDQLSLLKAGMAFSDTVTAVSPTYATEIASGVNGEGFDGFITADVRRLVGIVNGIDTEAWDPSCDPALPAAFSAAEVAGKAVCRAALAAEFGLSLGPKTLLLGVVARMSGQKGVDLIAEVVPELHALGAKLVVLGNGDPLLEDRFQWLAERFGEHLAVRIGFDAGLARRIYAGCDAFLMPSRFEPCGLGQMYAMRYGTIPIVHAVGGLVDTVDDPGDDGLRRGRGTGFAFPYANPGDLIGAIRRAAKLFGERRAWKALIGRAMRRDSGWAASARAYLEVYREAIADRRRTGP